MACSETFLNNIPGRNEGTQADTDELGCEIKFELWQIIH